MNILAIGCHPDDLVIACGGTLAKYARRGDKVFMVDIANGNLGHRIIEKDKLSIIRRGESAKAAEVIGAEHFCVDIGDCLVDTHDEASQDKLIDIIRLTKPDFIITHNEQDYMRDHVEAGNMAFSASFTAGCSHRITLHSDEIPFIENIPPIMYMDTLAGVNFLPTEYVDISETIDIKLEALSCHESQLVWMKEHDHIDFIDFVRTCSKFRGLQCGVSYAEGFRPCMNWPRMVPYRLLP